MIRDIKVSIVIPSYNRFNFLLNAHTNCVYVNVPCLYYDAGHGNGSTWK